MKKTTKKEELKVGNKVLDKSSEYEGIITRMAKRDNTFLYKYLYEVEWKTKITPLFGKEKEMRYKKWHTSDTISKIL